MDDVVVTLKQMLGGGGDNHVHCWLQSQMMFFVCDWNRCYHGWGVGGDTHVHCWLQSQMMFFVCDWNRCYHGWGVGGDTHVRCWLQSQMMFFVCDWNKGYHGWVVGGIITFIVDCNHRWCFSCAIETDVIMGGGVGGDTHVRCWLQSQMMFFVCDWNRCYHGWGVGGIITFIVGCTHRWCFSCAIETDVKVVTPVPQRGKSVAASLFWVRTGGIIFWTLSTSWIKILRWLENGLMMQKQKH